MNADEIDYRLIGDGIEMATTLDASGRQTGSLWTKLAGAGKRVLSGDSFFGTFFAISGNVRGHRSQGVGWNDHRFGGEGLFFCKLTGPGRVILQTLPFSRLADRIIAAAPRAGGRRREEGAVLGSLGNILDGDSS